MNRIIFLLSISMFLSALLFTGVAWANPDTFAVSWWTVDNGGAMHSAGGSFTVSGTVGQPDASNRGPNNSHKGGSYAVAGGFWQSQTNAVIYRVYLPIVWGRY